MEENAKRGPLSVGTGLLTLAAAAVLTFALYFVVGFPQNVPAAVGVSVLAAEVIESQRGGRPVRIARPVLHAGLAALASWLGVIVVKAFGGF